jgi:hypothetical protein
MGDSSDSRRSMGGDVFGLSTVSQAVAGRFERGVKSAGSPLCGRATFKPCVPQNKECPEGVFESRNSIKTARIEKNKLCGYNYTRNSITHRIRQKFRLAVRIIRTAYTAVIRPYFTMTALPPN